MDDRIETMHPEGKQGVNILRSKYDAVVNAINDSVAARQPIGFEELVEAVETRLGPDFDGSVPWYVTTIKLDLEARGVLERVPGRGPQRLRFASC
ncbi:MAG: hypothetical protein HKN29_03280 [Rhodothermales bacterium]|nr:hypothetical protein [Rhodothermales bacterium]